MKKLAVFLIGLILSTNLFAQELNPNRYRTSIFTDVLSITNVKYGEAPQWVWPYWDVDLELDVYVPDGDLNPKRPLIIFAHSGGFLIGSKDVDDMVAICDSFSQKGYVTASLDYRKGFDPLDGESAERAVYRGIQDGKAAVRYFKENASLYDIDTNNVFFGGMSAGGFISLHVGYMDKEYERLESTYGGGLVNDLECLDCAGNSYPHSSSVKAVIDCWGSVGDTLILESGDVPLLMMHGENDETVPFVYGPPFGLFTLPDAYGAQPISERAANLGMDYELYTSEGPLHMLDGSDNGDWDDDSPNSFWSDTLLPRMEAFLFRLIKPTTTQMSLDVTDLCFGETLTLEVSDSAESTYIWDYDTELIDVISDEDEATVELEFNNTGSYTITVVEFNCILAAGDTITYIVNVADEITAAFTESITDINTVDFSNESTGGTSYEWDFGDGESSTDMSPSHSYEEDGAYDVVLTVTNDWGCTKTFTITLNILGVGVNEYEFAEVDLYPNPFNQQFTIQSEQELAQITVGDASGRLVYAASQFNSSLIQVDASAWSTGVYFISIQNLNGQLVTKKLIKN
ncbi:MAG: PKD domain-containing protein [Crocinitomix sp.]|nr:PKD domain-containing protein [Crocinitomix sp.]